MAQRSIQTFNSSYIAIYRPNKRTYSILKFNHNHRAWHSNNILIHQDTLSLNQIQTDIVNVKIAYRNDKFVDCTANGKYLVWINGQDTYTIAILRKHPQSRDFPPSYFTYEFPCTNESILPPVDILWILAPVVAPVIPVVPPLRMAIIHRVRTPKEIPQRIAWIIAEDACKKEDTCPITLEPISPLTAAVTSCYHIFDANAIASWFERHSECPVCKTKCVTTICFNN